MFGDLSDETISESKARKIIRQAADIERNYSVARLVDDLRAMRATHLVCESHTSEFYRIGLTDFEVFKDGSKVIATTYEPKEESDSTPEVQTQPESAPQSQACQRCGAKWRALLYANGQSLCQECFNYKVGIR